MELDRQPILRGPTLVARPLRADDLEPLYAVARDPLIWAQHPQPDRHRREVFEPFFADALACGGALTVQAHDGAVVGTSRFDDLSTDRSEVEIGWTFLARSLWGGAANRELKRLMLDHAFGAVRRVVFRVGPENRRSRRAVEKLGAQLQSVDGEWATYALDRDDWPG